MKIFWTEFASQSLYEIFNYYKQEAGYSVANKIKVRIFNATRQLKKHPDSGQLEETLQLLFQGHRYLISGNYKIIYRRVDNLIWITDIFDTRQDPVKITRSTKKPSS